MNQAITHLLQYHPYRLRNERCAIGILSLLPDGDVRVHLASNLRKVRALNPNVNLSELRDELDKLALDIKQDPSLLSLYLQDGAGPLRLCPSAGNISYDSQEQYMQGVRWALEYGAEPALLRRSGAQREPTSRLYLEVKNYFGTMGWLAQMGQGIRDHRILARYNLSREEGVSVDFALLNSSMHYVQTVDMRATSNATHKRQEAQSKWFALGLAGALTPADLTGQGIKGYALIAGSDTEEGKKAVRAAERVADAGVYVHESSSDMDAFMAIMARAMHQEPLQVPPMH